MVPQNLCGRRSWMGVRQSVWVWHEKPLFASCFLPKVKVSFFQSWPHLFPYLKQEVLLLKPALTIAVACQKKIMIKINVTCILEGTDEWRCPVDWGTRSENATVCSGMFCLEICVEKYENIRTTTKSTRVRFLLQIGAKTACMICRGWHVSALCISACEFLFSVYGTCGACAYKCKCLVCVKACRHSEPT